MPATSDLRRLRAAGLRPRGHRILLDSFAGVDLAACKALGERVRVEVAELSDPQAAEQLIAAADADGGPDVLINNAGLTRDNLAGRVPR